MHLEREKQKKYIWISYTKNYIWSKFAQVQRINDTVNGIETWNS
jgi:hypothetical protein